MSIKEQLDNKPRFLCTKESNNEPMYELEFNKCMYN